MLSVRRAICEAGGGGVPIKFLSTPSARRATWSGPWRRPSHRHFYPHPPRGGRRFALATIIGYIPISIHALREEGDRPAGHLPPPVRYFYPRPPRGGRHFSSADKTADQRFLSTPSVRRATERDARTGSGTEISIHALREEGDKAFAMGPSIFSDFYPRPPRGGRRVPIYSRLHPSQFLSTPSARRATFEGILGRQTPEISIHALREEGDHRRASDL